MDTLKHLYIYRLPKDVLDTLKARSKLTVEDDITPVNDDDISDASYTDSEGEENNGPRDNNTISVAPYTVSAKGSPITWYTTSVAPSPTKVGVYTALYPTVETTLSSMQITTMREDRTIAMFMVGGGHFQGSIISLTESSAEKCVVKTSKGFHRYTTRRKQGGAQSANDSAKGAAKSAGAQIRRYNEIALAEDIKGLLQEWKAMLAKVDIILIRAGGQSSKKLLYENGLDKTDVRIRGFPLNTRRATQAEVIRSFHILTRLQIGSVEDDIQHIKPATKPIPARVIPVEVKADPIAVEHTDKLVALIKKQKVPAIRTYLRDHHIDVNTFKLEPKKIYVHSPTLLHYASAMEANPVIFELLNLGADPRDANSENKTAFEVAGSKSSRDVFRIWRGTEGNEHIWDWDAAKIPVGLSAEQIKARKIKEAEEKAREDSAEEERRKLEMLRLEDEAAKAKEQEQLEADRKRGPGRSLAVGVMGTSSSTSLEGLTPQMRQKIERERRARAAEARFKK